jgi:alkylation response protein AidB-like acyl-CoA dehydrogenase
MLDETASLRVETAPTAEELRALALEVRAHLRRRRDEGAFTPQCDAWADGWDPAFSHELARRGWVGMTIPQDYGGGGRSHVERFVVAEEMLASGAPVAFHWVTERQIAPQILGLGTEEQRRRFLPGIAAAELAFCLGMSEPGSGSDLASVRTRATRVDGGWLVSGQKIWTGNAHRANYMLALCRTSQEDDHHAGLSQLIIDLHADGVLARPIPAAIGDDHFAEVFFDDAFVPDEDVLGTVGQGWRQVTAELGYERGGSDRFMSNVPLLEAFVARTTPEPATSARVGELVARMIGLRALAMGVMEAAGAGSDFAADAALAKDAGNVYEQEIPAVLRDIGVPPDDEVLAPLLDHAVLFSPTISLRGGSTEVLRGITARRLVGR